MTRLNTGTAFMSDKKTQETSLLPPAGRVSEPSKFKKSYEEISKNFGTKFTDVGEAHLIPTEQSDAKPALIPTASRPNLHENIMNKSFANHFVKELGKPFLNKEHNKFLERQYQKKHRHLLKLKDIDCRLHAHDATHYKQKTGALTYCGSEILVIVINRSTMKYQTLKYATIPREIPFKILTEHQCMKISEDFLLRVQERIGLAESYRYLYDKKGQVVNNIIEFDRNEWVLLLSNIPDFCGRFGSRSEEISLDCLYMKIGKLTKMFSKKLGKSADSGD
jgi:hypothetical protein